MNLRLLFPVVFLTLLFSQCTSVDESKMGDTVIIKKDTTSIMAVNETFLIDTLKTSQLKYGFEIRIRDRYGPNKSKNIHWMEIWHRNVKIHTDTSIIASEYILKSEFHYPILNKLNPGIFELLIEYDNRPNKNQVTLFRIKDNVIEKIENIPSFDKKTEVINGKLTYCGFWDYGEVWDENGKRYTTYNPIIYYVSTNDGILVDTALTILRNKETYGRFEGFDYSGVIGYPSDGRGNITDTTNSAVLRRKDP